ncbi:MAG: hypothetical protein JW807_06130 [Spirochaetes bacterium]|nr:hypothetical protein [Spirochaetota bacterium]
MTVNENGRNGESKKHFKEHDFAIDKSKIVTVIVVIIALTGFMLFMFYLADVIG